MSITQITRRVGAGVIGLSLLVGAGGTALGAGPAAGGRDLQVTSAGPTAWPAHHRLAVQVVVRNPDATLLCSAFTITLTWWRPGEARNKTAMTVSPLLGAAATTLTIPAVGVQPSRLRYFVTATQHCGFLEPENTYTGRAPSTGSIPVTVLGG